MLLIAVIFFSDEQDKRERMPFLTAARDKISIFRKTRFIFFKKGFQVAFKHRSVKSSNVFNI